MSHKLLQTSTNNSSKSSIFTTTTSSNSSSSSRSRSNSSENIDFLQHKKQQKSNEDNNNNKKYFNLKKIQTQNLPLFRFISASSSEVMDNKESASTSTNAQTQHQQLDEQKAESRFEVAKVDEVEQPLIKKQHFSTREAHFYNRDGDEQSNQSKSPSKCYKVAYDSNEKINSVTFSCGSKLIASYVSCCEDFKTINYYKKLLAEYIGTMILVVYACSIGLPITELDGVPSINGCLGGGLTLATLVWCLGSTSGAHLNPAVSMAFLFTGKINPLLATSYIAFQLLGALSGSFILKALAPEFAQGNLSITQLSSELTLAQGVGIEFIITFILVLTVYACVDKKRTDLSGSFPLQIGFAVVIGGLFGGPLTGGSMNPARSFGPAAVTGMWTNHWIYWIGPISGAISAGFLYKFILTAKYLNNTQQHNKKKLLANSNI